MRRRRSWDELSAGQRTLVVLAGTIELSLLFAALTDLRRRPADQIHGSKRQWVALSFVNFVGPLSYFAFGRKR